MTTIKTPTWINELAEREYHSDTMKPLNSLETQWLSDWRAHFEDLRVQVQAEADAIIFAAKASKQAGSALAEYAALVGSSALLAAFLATGLWNTLAPVVNTLTAVFNAVGA